MSFTGMSPDKKFVEIIELHDDHPWFLGCQFHPELKSKPFACHPLFRDFIRAAKAHRAAKERAAEIEAVPMRVRGEETA
jgi:CTP synthase